MLVRNLLVDEWDASNTFGLQPDISYGWYDDSKSVPQVLVRIPDEGPIGGGQTGFDAIDPTGGTPHQTVDGVLEVHCFADRDDIGDASTRFPREYLSGDDSTEGVIGEIVRIIGANAQAPTDPTTGAQPVRLLAPLQSQEAPTEDAGAETAHIVQAVGYQFGR